MDGLLVSQDLVQSALITSAATARAMLFRKHAFIQSATCALSAASGISEVVRLGEGCPLVAQARSNSRIKIRPHRSLFQRVHPAKCFLLPMVGCQCSVLMAPFGLELSTRVRQGSP